MKLRFLMSVADNDRSYEGGEVYEVASAARAEHFLTHGIAQAVADTPSAAVVPEDTERATLPKAQKRAP
jgi:hypothetical protein